MTRPFRQITPADVAALCALVGRGDVFTEPAARARYARDESTRLDAMPDLVVRPADEAGVSAVLRWAGQGPFPVIVRGAGTGVAGGSVAVTGGVVLSLERFTRILEVDEENLTATVEPGVITARLQEEVERRGLFYPPDPASAEDCSIGGNVAVGAGGPRAVKYGTTRDYVLGMRVALASGEVIELGGKNVKDASGYHLMELMMGSEGTLGVITAITVRLLARPVHTVSLLMPLPDVEGAARVVAETIRRRMLPTVAEFMDEVAIRAAARYLGRELPHADKARAYVFLTLDGEDKAKLAEEMERVGAIGEAQGCLALFGAEDEGQQARLWESRKVLGKAMKALSPEIGKADVVVPRARVPALVHGVKALAADLGLDIACFGHAGDGNVHVNILRQTLDDQTWARLLPRALDGVMDVVASLGGRPSGEHGIGFLKRAELRRFTPEPVLALMRGVKAVFDPQGILNPGKVL